MTNDPTVSGAPPTLRFERWLAGSVDRVWRAITDEAEMAPWFPARVVGDRSVGADLEFPFDGGEAETFVGKVVEWSPPHVFAFTWHGDLLRFELSPDGDGARLVFTQTIHHMSEAARTAAGWYVCLANLSFTVDGIEPDPDAWHAKYLEYLRTLGAPIGDIDGETTVYDRLHFVGPSALEACFADPGSWGCDDLAGATIAAEAKPWGSTYRVTVPTTEATEAARWHGLLTQLDMLLASGQLVIDETWEDLIDAYENQEVIVRRPDQGNPI